MADGAPQTPGPRRRLRRGLLATLAGLLVMLALAGGALLFLLGSEAGGRSALRILAILQPDLLQVEGWQGRLGGQWKAQRLRFALPGFVLRAEGVEADWQPAALLDRHLRVHRLQIAALDIRTAPSGDPARLPDSLLLPITIEAPALHVGRLDIGQLVPGETQPPPTLQLTGLSGGFSATPGQLVANGLRGQWQALALQAEGRIATARPFALALRGQAETRMVGRAAQIGLEAGGSLEALRLAVRLSGEGLDGQLDTLLSPFAALPVQQASVSVRGLDPRLFHEAAPQASLDAQLSLHPRQLPGQVLPRDPADWILDGKLQLANRRPAAFDRDGLPLQELQADLQWAARHLQTTHLRLRMGDGELTGTAGWRAQAGDALGLIDADLQARGVVLDKLVAALRPMRLSGRLAAHTTAARQQFEADLQGTPAGRPALRLVLAGQHEAGVLKLSRASADWGRMQARLSGQLALQGRRGFNVVGQVAHLDPQAFSPAAPTGDINLAGRVGGVLAPAWQLDAALELQPSKLAGAPLTGQVKLAMDARRLRSLETDLDLLGNRLQASGALGAADDRLRFRIDAPQLAALHPELGGSVRGNGVLAGTPAQPWGALELRVAELRLPGDYRLSHASLQADLQPGRDGAFTARADVGRLSMAGKEWLDDGQLVLSGTRAQHALTLSADVADKEKLRLRVAGGLSESLWQGQLTELIGEGLARFHLREAVALELGPGRMLLGPARVQTENGLVELQQTFWTPQETVLRGRMRGLQLGVSVDEFQRTVLRGKSLSLGGDWDIHLGQTVNGLLRVYREDGDLILQGDTPVALGLETVDLTVAAEGGRLAASANVSGRRLGVMAGVLTASVVRDGRGLKLEQDAPLVANATLKVPSIAWLGPLIDQNIRLGGGLDGEFSLTGTPGATEGSGRIVGSGLEVALADQGMRLVEGELELRAGRSRLVLEKLAFSSLRTLPPPDARAAPPGLDKPGRLTGSGVVDLRSATTELEFLLDRVAALQTPRQWLVLSGPAKISMDKERLALKGQFRADGGYFGVPRRSAPSLSEDVVIRGQQGKPAQRLRLDADIRFDLGERFYLKAYGIDTRLDGQVVLNQEGGRWRMNGAIDTVGGLYAAYGQRLSIERGTVSFHGQLDNPALNVVALRKGLAVEAGVEVTGTARNPRVRLVSEPTVPESEKLSWLLLGRAAEANGQDTGLLLTAASAALGEDGEGVFDKVIEGAGIDQLSVGQGGNDVMRQRTSRVASTATGTPSSAAGATTPEDQVLTVGKRLSARTYLSLEQSLSGTDSVVKLTLSLNRFLSLIARAGTDNALDLQYTISFR